MHTDARALAAALRGSDARCWRGWHLAGSTHRARNDTRAALNTAARDHVHAQGQFGDDVDYGWVIVAVGDRIISRRN